MRLIDADAFLRSEIERCGCVPVIGSCTADNESFKFILEEQPTIEVYTEQDVRNAYTDGYSKGMEQGMKKQDVKHGKWIDEGHYITTAYGSLNIYRCSNCKAEITIDEYDSYCPNCNAIMDGE